MLIESALAAGIDTIEGGCLAKVALDDIDALLNQTANFRLIPLDGLGITEVEHGILVRHSTIGIPDVHALLNNLMEIAILGGEIRQLPETSTEAHFVHLFQHTDGVFETVLGKLIVALPIDIEPPGIEMDDIRRDAVLTEFVGNVESFFL